MRPSTRSRNGSTTSPPSTIGVIVRRAVRAAIGLGDDDVLRDVDETTRQVTRVRGLQRGIGQALTSTVRRVEVLQNVEAFAEVRLDRRLDDRAVRTRHQSAHAGQLTDLRRGTARAGVGHDVERVHRLLLDRLALGVLDLLGADAASSSPRRPARSCATRCRRPCCSARRRSRDPTGTAAGSP